MKQIILLSLLGLLSCSSNGQTVFPYGSGNYYYNYGGNYNRNHVKQYTEKIFDKRTKTYYTSSVHTLNSKGRELEAAYTSRKGKHTGRVIFTWKNDSLPLSYIYTKSNGDTTWKNIYEYDTKNNLVKKESFFGSKCQFQYTDQYEYNAANKLVSYASTNRKGKIIHRYEYEYYENGDRKETRYFNHKNKLKQRYTYACSPKGEVAENSKTQEMNYCKKTQYNADSSYLQILEKRNEKNEIVRTIWFYSSDSLLTRIETYDKIGVLESVTEYSYDSSKNPVVIKMTNDGKLRSTFKREYAGKDLVSKSSVYNKKDKLIGETAYEYIYFPNP